uniref:Uncharacterized protein n=1 Tax=Pantoea phage Survivor TaxID=3232176 RepID=A0AAU8KZB3_9CAUD
MSRYTFKLDTEKRVYVITDTMVGGTLTIEQSMSRMYVMTSENDQLVDLANDIQSALSEGGLALELHGENLITFKDAKTPWLTGHLQLRRCTIATPHLHNVTLIDFKADCVDEITITNSTIQDFSFYQVGKLHFSHCFLNDKYDFRKEITCTANEWHLNTNVTGTMW